MAYINTFATIAAMAEDFRLLRRGGGELVVDENLSEDQVIYWLATKFIRMQADKVMAAQSRGRSLSDLDFVDLTLPLTYHPATHTYRSERIGDVVSLTFEPQLKEATINGNPVSVSGGATHEVGYSRFSSARSRIYARRQYLHAQLLPSFCLDEPLELECKAMVQLSIDQLMNNPDEPMLVPQAWIDEMRDNLTRSLQVITQLQPDRTTNSSPA
ncbi:MAG: hypothetical protein EOO39_00500 [Cytophagaceae bacterium]|nr:MAG: hypothetical protein EOO39_00500 [Cytophagaceae bacterium]